MRNEKTFQAEFNLSFRVYFQELPYYYNKIRDDGGLQMYDAHLWWYGRNYMAIEYKINHLKNSINMASLFDGRHHQIRNIQQRINLGFNGWIIINWFTIKKGQKPTNRAFAISPTVASRYLDRTVKMEEFIADKEVIELERFVRLGKHYWEVSKLF